MIRNLSLQTPYGSLLGRLDLPSSPRGLIVLTRAHHAPTDTAIAINLATRGYALLAMELLTSQEAHFVDATQNVPKLSQRLLEILNLARLDGDMENLPLGIFATGDSTPAAIRAAAQRDTQVKALACHGGLIDRAGLQSLDLLAAPLLMLFDADDELEQNAYQRAASRLHVPHEMQVLDSNEEHIQHVAAWFNQYVAA